MQMNSDVSGVRGSLYIDTNLLLIRLKSKLRHSKTSTLPACKNCGFHFGQYEK